MAEQDRLVGRTRDKAEVGDTVIKSTLNQGRSAAIVNRRHTGANGQCESATLWCVVVVSQIFSKAAGAFCEHFSGR